MNLVFLDIDGVMRTKPLAKDDLNVQENCRPIFNGHCIFDRHCIFQLNSIFKQTPSVLKIVLNTAWNIHSLDDMKMFFTSSGLLYPDSIISQTNSCAGGFGPISDWLKHNGMIGNQYIIIDDIGSYGIAQGRLAHCESKIGLDRYVANCALRIIERSITDRSNHDKKNDYEYMEKHYCLEGILRSTGRLMHKSPLMPKKMVNVFTERNKSLYNDICLLHPADFMLKSLLTEI